MKHSQLLFAIDMVEGLALDTHRNLQMSGDPRYQPDELKGCLGYDQRASWLVLVEWFWMQTLAKIGVMSEEDAKLLTVDLLDRLLIEVTTTKQDAVEKETRHDILALLVLMREHLPEKLHPWLHFCATSYDIINTAYALQLKVMYEEVFVPKLRQVDELWRNKIAETAEILQPGRTHLQTALPITVGCWLSNLHNRFVNSARKAFELSAEIPGKFSGAVGTSAAQRALINSRDGEKVLMEMLGLPVAEVSTQITPPEGMSRFYHELVLLSGALANLGEDVRILQSSQFGEIVSASSTSSAMSHKQANPIAAENVAGMHVSVIAEFMKVLMTLVSDLQRDLRGSNVMRSYSAVAVYVYQQLLTTERILKSMKVNQARCRKNFDEQGKVVVAELLHLFLQGEGVPEAHNFVNQVVVPMAIASSDNLYQTMQKCVGQHPLVTDEVMLRLEQSNVVPFLVSPETYLGDAVEIARREVGNKL